MTGALALTLALTLTSCGKASVEGRSTDPEPVLFGVYGQRSTASKAADAGSTATKANSSYIPSGATFKAGDEIVVFGFYHDGTGTTNGSWAADEASGDNIPDFMYNQTVTKQDDGSWLYSPIKYWPNETGSDAVSDHTDALSFWGYYPKGVANLNLYRSGTTTAYDNESTGLPRIAFTQEAELDNQSDLLFSSLERDYIKPAVDGKVTLHFKHALSLVEFQIAEGTGAIVNSMLVTDIMRSGICEDPSSIVWTGQSDNYTFTMSGVSVSGSTIASMIVMPQTLASGTPTTQSAMKLTINYDITFASSDPDHPEPIVYSGNEISIPLWNDAGTAYGVKAWQAGKHYVYKIRAGFERIEFEECVATDWTTGADNISVQ